MTFSWTDFEDIALALVEEHPGVDPFEVTFPALREMVTELKGFEPEPGQKPNEQILEAIQVAWQEEIDDLDDEDAGAAVVKDDDDEDEGIDYEPNNPYR